MRRIIYLAIAVASLLSFSGCDKENPENENGNNETKGPKVETLSAEKGRLYAVSLTGRISGLEGVASDFKCGIEYSTDASFANDKTISLNVDKKYTEDPYTVTLTYLTSGQKYYYRAYYINQSLIYYGAVKDFIFTWEILPNGSENGYDYIEMGLSVKWASFNVGATKPEEYGDYFAWGEIEPKTDYSWSTYKWCNGSYNTMTKYCNNSSYGNNGFTDTKTTLAPEDDVAHVAWGGSWRMPTKAEQDDLRNNCTWTWYSSGNTEFNGVAGYKVTSNIKGYTDRFIFLPAADHYSGMYRDNVGSEGFYWSCSLETIGPNGAYGLGFYSVHGPSYNAGPRCDGTSVRPVCP